MRILLLSSILGLALSAAFAPDASAQRRVMYPWCAFYSAEGIDECLYSDVAQCRASVSGVGGYCYQNPLYVGPSPRRGIRGRNY